MGQAIHFTSSAELYENEYGELAVRFANNVVFAHVGTRPGKGFVAEAIDLLKRGERPPEWKMIPYRKLLHDGHGWHLVSSMGYIDDDKSKPAVGLDVKPESLGNLAKRYLKPDMPQAVKEQLT
jgi:hypothetical protein